MTVPRGLGRRHVPANMPWLLQRVRMMSPAEVAWRVRSRALLESWKRRSHLPPLVFAARPSLSGYRLPPSVGVQSLEVIVRRADGQLAGTTVALGQTFSTVDTDWHLDPQTGVSAPLDFGPLLDYRDGRLAGNSRNTWELNRHQHLALVALAFACTGEDRYAAYVRRQLESWLRQNPFPLGVNWNSPLELGLRLTSWVWIARLLADSEHGEALFGDRGLLWPSVYRHQWMIAALHSKGSSANNHLIGEMAGLFVAATTWPWFRESAGWARFAQQTLEREAASQYYPSGLNREQAFGYHLFATELLLLAGVEGDRAGSPFSMGCRARLRRAVRAAADLVGPNGLLPTFGDDDGGMAIGLPGGGSGAFERILAVASRWLGDVECAVEPSREARLAAEIELSGVPGVAEEAVTARLRPARLDAESTSFVDAGVYVMRSTFRGEVVSVLADAGELGYLSIAAHGHADALSFALAVADEPLLVDPGTFTYHWDPAARAYFRGTRAHNTVTVDGHDQSEAGGPFLWTRKARCFVQEWSETAGEVVLAASHDGYERLHSPVTHRRRLVLRAGQLDVDDELTGTGEHDVEWRLHLAPHCRAVLGTRECEVVGRRHRLSIQLDDALRWSVLSAQPQGGWFSPAFNRREPTATLVGACRLPLPLSLHHVLEVLA